MKVKILNKRDLSHAYIQFLGVLYLWNKTKKKK